MQMLTPLIAQARSEFLAAWRLFVDWPVAVWQALQPEPNAAAGRTVLLRRARFIGY